MPKPKRNHPIRSLAPFSLSLLNMQSLQPPTTNLFTDRVTTYHEAQELGIQAA
jgi:hypothetical protein